MAIDFPNSPSANQTYTVGATTWTYDGEKWVVTTSGRTGPSAVVVSDTAPSIPSSGTLWYNSTNGKTYAYYTDSTSSQWVEVGNADPTFNTLTTKGDILTRSSSAMTRLGVGANDYVLTANSSATEGMSWGTSPKVVANAAARPSLPFEGQMIYEADTDMLAIWNGSAWRYVAATTPTNGTVLRVVSATKTDTFTYTTSTFTDVPGLTATITPYSSSNKIMVIASVSMMHATSLSEAYARLARNGTGIAVGDASGSRPQVTSMVNDYTMTVPMFHLDAPASTSSLTYSVQVRTAVAQTAHVNRTYADGNNTAGQRAVSSITLMEIAG